MYVEGLLTFQVTDVEQLIHQIGDRDLRRSVEVFPWLIIYSVSSKRHFYIFTSLIMFSVYSLSTCPLLSGCDQS